MEQNNQTKLLIKYERALTDILQRFKVPNSGKFSGMDEPVFMIAAKALELEINKNSVY